LQIQETLKISNSQELQNALTNLAKELIASSSEKFVDIGILGSQFHKRYGQPITTMLKTLNINKKFPTFLQVCPGLQVQQKEKGWQITMR
jgi:hypothetical protein